MAPKSINMVQLWLIVLLATQASALSLPPKQKTVALYLPIDIKYVRLQVPDESLKVPPLNSPVINMDDILKEINKATVEPIKTNEDLSVVPLKTDADAMNQAAHDSSQNVQDDKSRLPSPAGQQIQEKPGNSHGISKRQAQRFPYYRPVIRFSRFSSSRRRVGGFSKSSAMVGYLNDRDYFPTVA